MTPDTAMTAGRKGPALAWQPKLMQVRIDLIEFLPLVSLHEELVESIDYMGLIYPIYVRRQSGANLPFKLIDGHKRLIAWRELSRRHGLERFHTIPAIAVSSEISEHDQHRICVDSSMKLPKEKSSIFKIAQLLNCGERTLQSAWARLKYEWGIDESISIPFNPDVIESLKLHMPRNFGITLLEFANANGFDNRKIHYQWKLYKNMHNLHPHERFTKHHEESLREFVLQNLSQK